MPPHTNYPLQVSRADINELFVKVLKPKFLEDYESCVDPSFIVHPNSVLTSFFDTNVFKKFQYGMDLDVVITPEVIETEETLRKLPPLERECYFENEKTLRFFKIYSVESCEEECFTNYTFAEYDCVIYNKPRSSEIPICKGKSEIFVTEFKTALLSNQTFSTRVNCSCLPLCNTINYKIQYFPMKHRENNETSLRFKFNTEDLVVYRRYQQFTTSDVISYVGGLLGLFAGISFLSIFELFYFMSLRLLVNLWRLVKATDG